MNDTLRFTDLDAAAEYVHFLVPRLSAMLRASGNEIFPHCPHFKCRSNWRQTNQKWILLFLTKK